MFDQELGAGEAILGFRWEGKLDAGSMLGVSCPSFAAAASC